MLKAESSRLQCSAFSLQPSAYKGRPVIDPAIRDRLKELEQQLVELRGYL
jgi:hypothetical protein